MSIYQYFIFLAFEKTLYEIRLFSINSKTLFGNASWQPFRSNQLGGWNDADICVIQKMATASSNESQKGKEPIECDNKC